MAPITINRKRTYAEFTPAPPVPRFVKFDDLEVWDIDKPRSIIVRVEVKFPANFHGDEQHFIIMDIMGSKIEAIVLDTSVPRLNMLLSEGRSYVLHQVKFHPNCEDLLFRNIAHPYECIFNSHTTVEPYTEALQFPLHPRHLMPLDQVRGRPNKTFMDIAGIIVHWGQLEHLGHYPQRKAYREITLMDTSFNLIIVGIHSEYLTRHAISLPSAATNKQIVLGTMLKKNKRHACLETSRHTTLAFNPVHPATHGLQRIRQSLMSGDIDLRFVNRFHERRWAYLATVL